MKYIDAEKLKAEIERRITDNTFGAKLELIDILAWLDTLESEKPINPDDAMKELDEKIALVKQRGTWDGVDVDKYMDEVRGREPEKPIEGLEEEIDRLWESFADEMEGPHNLFDIYARLARHFAQWGAEHSGSSEIPNDLEEAAEISFDEAYALTEDYRDFLAKGLTENRPRPIGPHWFCEYGKIRFIAGAKWQAEKDAMDMYMSDNRHFEKVYQLGRTDMREQMMKEAVEGEVRKDGTIGYFEFSNEQQFHSLLEQFQDCDKVRIIIVKE